MFNSELSSKDKISISLTENLMFYIGLLLYVFILYFQSNSDIEALAYSVLHALFATYVIKYIWRQIIAYYNRSEKFPLILVFLLLHGLYFELSSVKYFSISRYGNFVDGNFYRFLLSIFSGAIILCCNYIYRYRPIGTISKRKHNILYYKYNVSSIAMITSLSLFIYSNYVTYMGDYVSPYFREQVVLSWQEQAITVFNSLFFLFLLILSVNYMRKNSLLSKVPMAIVLGVQLIGAMMSGSRGIFFTPLAMVFVLVLILKKINVFKYTKFLAIIPFLVMIVSIVAFNFSGRYGGETNPLVKDLSYRLDMTDYPLLLLENRGLLAFSTGTITEGFRLAIPVIIGGEKSLDLSLASKHSILDEANLAYVDYTDTYFSMGTENFGLLGFTLLLPIVSCILNRLDLFCDKFGAFLPFAKMSFIMLYIKIELEWSDVFQMIRQGIIYLVLLAALYKLFIRVAEIKEK